MIRRRVSALLYALSDAPFALAGALFVLLTFGAGARGWGRFEQARARILLAEGGGEPAPKGWRAVLYLLVKVPLAAVTTALALSVHGGAGLGLSYPMWYWNSPMVFGTYTVDTPFRVLAVALIGLALLVAAPAVLAGPLSLSRLAVRGLLGPDRLDARVRLLEQARRQALEANAATLRHIERDLHDGTQARLVTLAMDLGHARELLDDLAGPGPQATRLRETLEAAHRNAQQAVTELRGIVGRIHPPVLDTGLEPALLSLTQALTVPVAVRAGLACRPAPAVETIAYFCAVELLGNVVRHSGAGTATVELRGDADRLTLRVTDDGTGGAAIRGGAPGAGGTGLAGLAARVATVEGTLRVDSPAGGPTVVTVELPVTV